MNFPTTMANIEKLSQYLNEEVKVNLNTASNDSMSFLSFKAKLGSYLLGSEKEDITGQNVIVDTASMSHGWLHFLSTGVNRYFSSVFEEEPTRPAGVREGSIVVEPLSARSFVGVLASDTEVKFKFEVCSLGGCRGFDTLLAEIRSRSLSGETEALYPVVKLCTNNYYSKAARTTIHNCVFKVESWVKRDATPTDVVAEGAAEEAPVRRRRQVAN